MSHTEDAYKSDVPFALPTHYIKSLLRFRHNVERKVIVDPDYSFDRQMQIAIRTKRYTPSGLLSIDFWSSIEVPMICTEKYTGTTATLFAPSGEFIAETTTNIHPRDQFCRLTGRTVAQSKIINILRFCCIETGYCLDNSMRTILIKKLLANKTAQPLNW